jgi:iron complex transport system substrate-binding protein
MDKIEFKITLILFWILFWVPASGDTLTVKDMAGREVQVPIDPQKIVGIGPGALRLLVYLQAWEKVVGVEKMEKMSPQGRPYWLARPELSNLPNCGPGDPDGTNKKPDLESIKVLNPQVVFAARLDVSMADEAQKISGIPFVVLRYGESGGDNGPLFDSLKIAGKILSREKRAEDILFYFDTLRKDLNARTRSIPAKQRPSVYVGGIRYNGTFGIESTEKSYIPFSWLNANNLSDRLESKIGSHVFLDKEALLQMNPEMIFIDGGGLALVTEDFFKKPEYYFSFKAFSKKSVFTLLPFNGYATNLCTALADAYAVGKILYPESFTDIDPEKKADEIYTFMVGKPVYAAMKKDYGPIGAMPPFLKPEE